MSCKSFSNFENHRSSENDPMNSEYLLNRFKLVWNTNNQSYAKPDLKQAYIAFEND
jgi:hypothetical protein